MKPCPFCGSLRLSIYRCANGDWRIRCECGAVGPPGVGAYSMNKRDAARQLWDDRTFEPRGHVTDLHLREAGVGR
jgi:hypothetical protein